MEKPTVRWQCYDLRVERAFFVYLMSSKSRTLYLGVTGNLVNRVGQYKDGYIEGFTSDYLCTRLVWFERYKYVGNAIVREKQIKRWRREKKIWLIEQAKPIWGDLAEHWWDAIQPYIKPPENA